MVQILTGAAAGVRSTFVMPDDKQLRRLEQIVLARYPKFGPDGESDHVRYSTMRHAFWAVGQLGRLNTVEQKNARSLPWWADHASQILYDSGVGDNADIGQALFSLIVLMHGDICHTIMPSRWPCDVSFGLSWGTGDRPATAQWRGLLDGTRGILAPAEQPRLVQPPTEQQVRITVAGEHEAPGIRISRQ